MLKNSVMLDPLPLCELCLQGMAMNAVWQSTAIFMCRFLRNVRVGTSIMGVSFFISRECRPFKRDEQQGVYLEQICCSAIKCVDRI